jgi:hypothetical protein
MASAGARSPMKSYFRMQGDVRVCRPQPSVLFISLPAIADESLIESQERFRQRFRSLPHPLP